MMTQTALCTEKIRALTSDARESITDPPEVKTSATSPPHIRSLPNFSTAANRRGVPLADIASHPSDHIPLRGKVA
jgi:hypothetical protein